MNPVSVDLGLAVSGGINGYCDSDSADGAGLNTKVSQIAIAYLHADTGKKPASNLRFLIGENGNIAALQNHGYEKPLHQE